MLETLGADYMRTAKAKGLSERRIVVGHGLRNAMLPVVTLLGLDLGATIGAAVLTETVFSWPGLGSTIAQAVTDRDLPVVLGLTLAVVVVYSLVNLIVDVSYAWFDPRVRLGRGRGHMTFAPITSRTSRRRRRACRCGPTSGCGFGRTSWRCSGWSSSSC